MKRAPPQATLPIRNSGPGHLPSSWAWTMGGITSSDVACLERPRNSKSLSAGHGGAKAAESDRHVEDGHAEET